MRSIAAASLPLFLAAAVAQLPPRVDLQEVPFPMVRVQDPFFAPRRATNLKVTLAHSLRQLEETGTLGNFDLAAAGKHDGFKGYVFQDSDAYKALEAIAFALATDHDPALAARFDAIVDRIGKAQQADGYLNSSYTVQRPGRRFINLRDDHELYCAGHLFEAAAAHWQATGKRNLLDIAIRYADLLVTTFGEGQGRRDGYCGHPEIELALVKLARAAGKPEYLQLADWFVTRRGSRFFAQEHREDPQRYDGTYWLDHAPITELTAIAGHAVRATYLMSGAVDVGAATGNDALLKMARRVWRNTVGKNAFVTGGIGPSASNEGFTHDYDLPTHTAYQETCASIAMAMWAHRMNLLWGDGAFADAMETALYNAIPAGVQLDGTKFFYVNPLASRGQHHRRAWYGCACCPPNVARTLAAIGSYAYATGPDSLWVNLYVQGEVMAQVAGQMFALQVTSEYPWQGEIALRVIAAPREATELRLRIPGWCTQYSCKLGDADFDADGPQLGYLAARRQWLRGDVVKLSLAMPVRRLEADPRAEALRGQIAFARGPIVYCAEQVDQQVPVDQMIVPPGTGMAAEHRADLLGGVTVLTGQALDGGRPAWSEKTLYRAQPAATATPVTFVPYAVWDNRAPGAMAVWFPQAPRLAAVGGPEQGATVTMSFQNWNCDPEGVRDGEEPRRSGDTPPRNCHWWNHAGTTEWVEYSWPTARSLAGSRVFWFDDSGHGGCRLPKSARLLWKDGDTWRPVVARGAELPLAIDRWCEVAFEPITTTAIRLEVQMQEGMAAGVLEWQLVPADEDR